GGLFAQITAYLPQVGNGQFAGGSIRTTFVFFNTSNGEASIDLSLTKSDGTPMTVNLGVLGTGSQFTLKLGLGETKIVQTSGEGALAVGAARISSDRPIGSSAIFTLYDGEARFRTEAGVGSTEPRTGFMIPIDARASFNTGLALFNPGGESASISLKLLTPDGEEVDTAQLDLGPGKHRASFVAGELFSEIQEFTGTMVIDSSQELAAMTLRQNTSPLSFTTLPVVSLDSQQLEFAIPHVADGEFSGGSIRTTFLLFNLTDQAGTLRLKLTKDNGLPLDVTLPGLGTKDSFEVELAAQGSLSVTTEGSRPVTGGAARISSDVPVGVATIFSILDPQGAFLTEAGVGAATGMDQFQVPVEVTDSSNTGIALFNPGSEETTIDLTLIEDDRDTIRYTSTLTVGPLSRQARFVTELFPEAPQLKGSVVIRASREISAMTLRQNSVPLSFTTLPVQSRNAVMLSSFEVIDEAVAAGSLDEETGLIYKTYAAFGDGRLPAAYRGDDGTLWDTRIYEPLYEKIDTLSPEAQEILLPFLVPPFYEGSWYDFRQQAASGSAPLQSVPPCTHRQPTPCPISTQWESLDTANGKMRIWHRKGITADRNKALDLKEEVDARIWPKLQGFLEREPISDASKNNNGGDGKLDVALVDLGGNWGENWPYLPGCEDNPVYLLLNVRRSSPELRATLTHELMHALQWSYDVSAWCLKSYRWLNEATATWAMDYVYPPGNTGFEQSRAANLLDFPEQSLDHDSGGTVADPHVYGAYLFPFFIDRGYSDRWIRYMIEAMTEVDSGLEAVAKGLDQGGATDFERRWPEFALRNWNHGPIDQYQRWDGLMTTPEVRCPFQPCNRAQGAELKLGSLEQVKIPLPVDLPHLSSNYYHFRFADQNSRSVAFYNGLSFKLSEIELEDGMTVLAAEQLTDRQKEGASIQALVKIEGKDWETRDWTDSPINFFCRDIKSERLEELVLILSNYEHEEGDPNFESLQPRGIDPVLWVSNMGCSSWEGTVSLELNEGGPIENFDGAVRWKRWASMFPPPLEENPSIKAQTDFMVAMPSYVFEVESGSFDWSISGTDGDCTVSGSEEGLPISGLGNGLVTYNYVVGGEYKRGFTLAGFMNGFSEYETTVTYSCPPDQGGTFTEPWTIDFTLDLSPEEDGANAKVTGDGTKIHVTDPDTGASVRLRSSRE
ncbi:MAG: hypothetical protein JSU96_08105, partial [Acidobacteriota bacterium]